MCVYPFPFLYTSYPLFHLKDAKATEVQYYNFAVSRSFPLEKLRCARPDVVDTFLGIQRLTM